MDWRYNAWGGKYPPYDLDQQVAKRVADYLGISHASPQFCFEGGAIEVNDRGVLLCTRSCALNPNRNPGLKLSQVESILKQYLGVKICIWLTGNPIEGDDTDGHIDQIARFVNPTTIVVGDRGREQEVSERGDQTESQRIKGPTGFSWIGGLPIGGVAFAGSLHILWPSDTGELL